MFPIRELSPPAATGSDAKSKAKPTHLGSCGRAQLPMQWGISPVGILCLPCSPRVLNQRRLALLLSVLHTDRMKNRGLELNPNIPPEQAPSCAAMLGPRCYKEKEKLRQTFF